MGLFGLRVDMFYEVMSRDLLRKTVHVDFSESEKWKFGKGLTLSALLVSIQYGLQ